MDLQLCTLPLDIIYHILSYNRHFVIKHGKLHTIRRLDMSKYNLDFASKTYITNRKGFVIQFKNKRHRIYYKEEDYIEIVFESIYIYDGNLIVLRDSHFIE